MVKSNYAYGPSRMVLLKSGLNCFKVVTRGVIIDCERAY